MELFDPSKSILENLSYVGSIIVSALGVFAIWQLVIGIKGFKIAKETLEQAKNEFIISSQRAAAYEAVQLCEKFVKDIVIKINNFESTHSAMRYPKVINGIKSFDGLTKINLENKEETLETIEDYYLPNTEFFLTILNDMETFAMYFTKKIADEDIAYQTVGKTFLDYVESYHYFIIVMNHAQGNTTYRNIRALYQSWKFEK